jgi:hypothetical protein
VKLMIRNVFSLGTVCEVSLNALIISVNFVINECMCLMIAVIGQLLKYYILSVHRLQEILYTSTSEIYIVHFQLL